jgi:hypothetical protein
LPRADQELATKIEALRTSTFPKAASPAEQKSRRASPVMISAPSSCRIRVRLLANPEKVLYRAVARSLRIIGRSWQNADSLRNECVSAPKTIRDFSRDSRGESSRTSVTTCDKSQI